MAERVYLDHAATTALRPAALAAMTEQLGRLGNPSSLHASGRAARRVVEESREQIAACVGAHPAEVVFTGGGTESDNLALAGSLRARAPERTAIVTSSVEHPAVAETVAALGSDRARAGTVGCDAVGVVDLDALTAAVDGRTAVVSVMWANNETGTVQPVGPIAEIAHRAGAWCHADAVQALGQLPLDYARAGPDLVSLSAHKVGGPLGVGALLVRRDITLAAIQHGGGQERDIRSGTVNTPAIAAFAAALTESVGELDEEVSRLRALREALVAGVLTGVDGTRLNGTLDPARSLPSIANIEFAGCEADALLMLLDAAGIDASTGSACTAGVAQPSDVLLAMGRDRVRAASALRFSLGSTSTAAHVERLLAVLPDAVASARAASGRL